MALTQQLSNASANAEVEALAALLDGGFFDIYSGVQPATADTPITTQVLLASLAYGTPAYGAAVGGAASSNPIADDPDAAASGQATWYRMYKADHVTAVQDGSVGTIDCNLNMTDVNIVQHAVVSIASFTLTARKN